MFKEYRAHLLAKDRGQGTVDLYLRRLERFQRHFPDLTTVTLEDIEDHLAARRDLLAAETRKGLRTTLRSFYQWAYRRGLVEQDPTVSLAPIRVHVAPPRVAPDDAVRQALAKATPAESAMVMLGRYACLRLAELTTLHTDQREGDLLRIVGKGQKVRMVPINDELLLALLRLERTQGPGYYFPSRGGAGPHLHTQSVSKIIRRLVGWNPHSLRHAGATAAYEATGDLRAVQMLLGHSSIATTQRYLNIGIDAVRRVAAATALQPRPRSQERASAA